MDSETKKEKAGELLDCVNEMFEAIPKSRQVGFVGHLNEICLFLESIKRGE